MGTIKPREVYVKGDIDEGSFWWRFVHERQSDFSLVLKADYDRVFKALSIAVNSMQGEAKILEAAGHKGSAFGLNVSLKKIQHLIQGGEN